MKIIEPAVVECNKCGERIEIDVDMELVSSDEGRGMGTESQYEGSIEFECAKCGNKTSIKTSAWEYPQGALNDSDVQISGAKLIKEPMFSCMEE